ncbi:hypothetical protein ACSSS7_006612 [Eimeria intestinalis]
MRPFVALVAGVFTLDFSVLGLASTGASQAFPGKPSVNSSGDPLASAREEDWGHKRLEAPDSGKGEEAPGDAIDDELPGGVDSRRLAALDGASEHEPVEVGLQERNVAE